MPRTIPLRTTSRPLRDAFGAGRSDTRAALRYRGGAVPTTPTPRNRAADAAPAPRTHR